MSEDSFEKKGLGLSSQKQKKIRTIAVIAVVILAMFAMFHLTGQRNKLPQAEKENEALDLGTGLLQDDIWEKFETEQFAQDDTNLSFQKQLKEEKEKSKELSLKVEEILKTLKGDGQNKNYHQQDNAEVTNNAKYPVLDTPQVSYPAPQVQNHPEDLTYSGSSEVIDLSSEWLGGLASDEYQPHKTKSKKKERLKFYQPPSFFDAKLLTGIDALTSKEAKSDPEQVFLMITAPAVLPNHIKQNLKGCFVVANATGNLAKERVQLQVVNLSCVSADGNAVIDEPVLGFVSDKDGKRDLAGNVVSKAGTKMALLMVASAVGAVGEAVNLQSIDQEQSVYGTTNVVNLDELPSRVGGTVLKDTSSDYKDVIMGYIKQSAPVVEIGAMKDATVFLQKGVWLKIMDRYSYNEDGKESK